MAKKIERLWNKVDNVARGRVRKVEKENLLNHLDTLFEVTVCQHTITLCDNHLSGCSNVKDCKFKAHIICTCPRECKIPEMELRWLFSQRNKTGEKADMMMSGVDKKETKRQNKAVKRMNDKIEAERKRRKRDQEEELSMQERISEFEGENIEYVQASTEFQDPPHEDHLGLEELIDNILASNLGEYAYLVKRFLMPAKSKQNTMPIPNTASACVRYGISSRAGAAIASEFLKDLIAAEYLKPEMSFLACDGKKIARAKEKIMKKSRENDTKEKIIGIAYDGRKDSNTKSMVRDSATGNMKMVTIKEDHETVTIEPSGEYLTHFVPDTPIYPEKPALKIAQKLHEILVEHDSVYSLQVLQGDSTAQNTGWKGGTHAHLEKLLGRKLFWGICNIHTNELPLRHLIARLDGPTCSNKGFTGPVCSLLTKIDKMEFNPHFDSIPDGEDMIDIPDHIVENMSTDQKLCYKLVKAIKTGHLPESMISMSCGPVCHARWLTTGQRILFMWTRKHGLHGKSFKVLEMLVQFCVQWYFKLFFDIKVKHNIADAPYHILTSIRILKTQPTQVQEIVTPYIKSGAWYSHSECIILSLLSSTDFDDRSFAVDKILQIRGKEEFGNTNVRPRVLPKLNLDATNLKNLIHWEKSIHEPIFTCLLTKEEVKSFLCQPFKPPNFSSHTQSTERAVKLVTEASANVCGQQARDGYIKALLHHRQKLPNFISKKDMLETFDLM